MNEQTIEQHGRQAIVQHRAILLLVLVLNGSTGAIAASASSVNAATTATTAAKLSHLKISGPLSPAERARIQAVGQALLLSNQSLRRHPDRDAEQLRQQIIAVQAALAAVIAPVSTVPVQISTPSPTATRKALTVSSDAWPQVHAASVGRLRQAVAALSHHAQLLQQNRAAANHPGLLQTFSSWFNNAPVSAPGTGIVTPVTDAALTRTATLPAAIEKALALPPAQRQQRLTALTEEFRLRATPIPMNALTHPRQADVPTLVMRHSAIEAQAK